MKIDRILSDEEIRNRLYTAAPEGFNWDDLTESEMVKFKLIAKAQRDLTLRLMREKLGLVAFILDNKDMDEVEVR